MEPSTFEATVTPGELRSTESRKPLPQLSPDALRVIELMERAAAMENPTELLLQAKWYLDRLILNRGK